MATKTAADYILRIKAGASVDPTTMLIVNPNDELSPILIDSEHFVGYVVVRVLNFAGVTPSDAGLIPNPASNYFKGRNRRYSIMVQGRWKKEWSGDDVVFSLDVDSKCRVPTGASIGIKIAKWLDPSLGADLYCDKPWIASPLITAMNALAIYLPSHEMLANGRAANSNDKLSKSKSATSAAPSTDSIPALTSALASTLVSQPGAAHRRSPSAGNKKDVYYASESRKPSEDIGQWSFHDRMVPEETALLLDTSTASGALSSYDKRKKYFSDESKRKGVTLKTDRVYCMDFYDAYFDFNTVSLKLPGFSLNAFKYWDGQPLRFTARTRDRSVVFFSVLFELLERASLGLPPDDESHLMQNDMEVRVDNVDIPPSILEADS
ncbi:uncharacterized protein BJ171DRAFT_111306 [Polychytrium aggregatum]|uniref:uncharacterized protein n=1 Tax=Polychytrium aggregatum TaxID=110093 RepID=UPI0022FE0DA2|nr:uncharacterized protein BJ171DRAFT_111306 [Polychytrium aggregatum]KAI9209213.1 hypothetical protein BJ171DRAFT_111306 [Polychytrium aggregatum]